MDATKSRTGRPAIALAGLVALAMPALSGACARSTGAPAEPALANYEVRDTAEYSNTIYGGRLGLLYRKDALVDSIDLEFGLHAVPGGVLYLPVRAERHPDMGELVYFTEHVLYDGRTKETLSERLRHFDPHFSSPSVIDSRLYYWGLERGADYIYRIYALRYDFTTERTESLFLYQAPLATDNPFHFGRPHTEDGWVRFETYGRTFRVDAATFELADEGGERR